MTTVRKSLHPLQPAAGDKENLVGPGRMITPDKDNLKNLREANENLSSPQEPKMCNKRKKVASKSVQAKPLITEEDLTSTDGPSENYWELLAEERRKALEQALIENERLHAEIKHLEEKNKIYKEMLDEQECLVDVLKEMLNDPADESSNINDSLGG